MLKIDIKIQRKQRRLTLTNPKLLQRKPRRVLLGDPWNRKLLRRG